MSLLSLKLSSLMEPLINPPQLRKSESRIQKEKNSLGIIATQITNDPTHLKHNFTHTFDAWAFREIQHLEPRLLTRTAGVTLTHRSAFSELPALCEPKGVDVLEPLQREEVDVGLEGRPSEVQPGKPLGNVIRHEHLERLEARGGQLERVRGKRVRQRLRVAPRGNHTERRRAPHGVWWMQHAQPNTPTMPGHCNPLA